MPEPRVEAGECLEKPGLAEDAASAFDDARLRIPSAALEDADAALPANRAPPPAPQSPDDRAAKGPEPPLAHHPRRFRGGALLARQRPPRPAGGRGSGHRGSHRNEDEEPGHPAARSPEPHPVMHHPPLAPTSLPPIGFLYFWVSNRRGVLRTMRLCEILNAYTPLLNIVFRLGKNEAHLRAVEKLEGVCVLR